MKVYITIILASFVFGLQGQDHIFDQKDTQSQREQDLLNFIKSDIELYDHYRSGEKNIGSAKGFGYTSIGFLSGGALLVGIGANQGGWDGLGTIAFGLLSGMAGSLIGTIGIILHVKGKGKIRDVMNYAEHEIGSSYSRSFKLEKTNNGIGLVFSF